MLKFLVVLLVVGIGVWSLVSRLRGPGRGGAKAGTADKPTSVAPVAMVECAHCGLHLPAVDAVAGHSGAAYCSPAHRQLVER